MTATPTKPITAAHRPAPPAAPPGPPPAASMRLLEMLTAPWIAQAMYVVARFDIADRLADGPRSAESLAAETGLHADTLFRMLRTLASVGVFTETRPRHFGLGETGQYLRGDVQASQKYSALLFGAETFRAWAEVLHTARTGEPAFDKVFGRSFYSYLEDHSEASELFNRVMAVAGVVPPVTRAFDFTPHRHVVDVGGGSGAVIAAILAGNPEMRGTLVDLPEAVAGAEPALSAAGVSDRCARVAGSFFEPLPEGADLYLLSRVLHNWSDADAVRILRNVRAAVPAHGRLLVCERFLPDGDEYHIGKVFDLVMLVMLGGRDRSAAEYRDLLGTAGFEVTGQEPGPAGVGMLVARPAG